MLVSVSDDTTVDQVHNTITNHFGVQAEVTVVSQVLAYRVGESTWDVLDKQNKKSTGKRGKRIPMPSWIQALSSTRLATFLPILSMIGSSGMMWEKMGSSDSTM